MLSDYSNSYLTVHFRVLEPVTVISGTPVHLLFTFFIEEFIFPNNIFIIEVHKFEYIELKFYNRNSKILKFYKFERNLKLLAL